MSSLFGNLYSRKLVETQLQLIETNQQYAVRKAHTCLAHRKQVRNGLLQVWGSMAEVGKPKSGQSDEFPWTQRHANGYLVM